MLCIKFKTTNLSILDINNVKRATYLQHNKMLLDIYTQDLVLFLWITTIFYFHESTSNFINYFLQQSIKFIYYTTTRNLKQSKRFILGNGSLLQRQIWTSVNFARSVTFDLLHEKTGIDWLVLNIYFELQFRMLHDNVCFQKKIF